jgi:hypothetical protein
LFLLSVSLLACQKRVSEMQGFTIEVFEGIVEQYERDAVSEEGQQPVVQRGKKTARDSAKAAAGSPRKAAARR